MRALADPVEEIAQYHELKPALVPDLFNGGTRITRRLWNAPWDAYIPGLADHVLVAVRGGSDATIYTMDGKTRSAPQRAGLVTVVPSGRDGLWHGPGAHVSNVFLSHERLMNVAEQVSGTRPVELKLRVNGEDPTLYAILELLSGEAERGAGSSRLFIEHLLDLACLQLLRAHSVFDHSARERLRGLAAWQVKRVTEYMHANLDKDIGLQDLADLVGLSRFYFCSAFRMATGYTPHEWLTRLRIEDARRLLAIQSMSITDIALAVGYQTPSAFAAAFRRLMGVSPREYRRRL